MLKFVIRKMLSKKWMILSLLIGNILFISITATNPMYTRAVLQRTLTTSLSDYLAAKNKYPLTVTLRSPSGKHGEFQEILSRDAQVEADFGQPAIAKTSYYYLSSMSVSSDLTRDNRGTAPSFVIGTLSDLPEHIALKGGSGMTRHPDENGVVDAVVYEQALLSSDLLLGETLTFEKIKDEEGNPLRLRIAGVFSTLENDELYWVSSPASYTNTVFIDGELFEELFLNDPEGKISVFANWFTLLDYQSFGVEQVPGMLATIEEYKELGNNGIQRVFSCTMEETLNEFTKTELRVRSTLLVLQTPVLILTAAFIFMVSRHLLDMEQSEIAVIKSRGASRRQIIGVYLTQSIVVVLLSALAALPTAMLLVQILGSANAFLEFVGRKALEPIIDRSAMIYVLGASVFSVCTMVLPVFRYSKVGIVAQKQKKNRHSETPLWQKFFLDFIILGIALYGLYSFNRQKAFLAQQVLDGVALDPLLFLSSSLFMLGSGLVALRILPLLIKGVFNLCKKQWSPALYASFLRVLRSRSQQGFIMVFLVMTIAMGIFDATAARTINEHSEQELRYTIGADLVLREEWADNSDMVEEGMAAELEYTEPDFERYTTLPGVESAARVMVNTAGTVTVPGGSLKNVRIMGIHTKDFGNTAWFDASLLPHHWYEYLNAMSQRGRAILVSSNFAKDYGYKIGDTISYKIPDGNSLYGIIYGFVDYWPGYEPTVYGRASNGLFVESKQYLVVANLSQLQAVWGVTPYEIWLKTSDSSRFIYDYAAENKITYQLFRDTDAEIVELKNDPLIQGTNGILTVGFIVVLVLCMVGFLIYWIVSIRSRELQFGIFRAMGMSMREIITMLLNEQFYISVTSILIGGLVGSLSAKLYMPLIQIAYSSSDNSLPLRVISWNSDLIRLAVIVGLMVAACLVILAWIIRKMKIAQALKLGED